MTKRHTGTDTNDGRRGRVWDRRGRRQEDRRGDGRGHHPPRDGGNGLQRELSRRRAKQLHVLLVTRAGRVTGSLRRALVARSRSVGRTASPPSVWSGGSGGVHGVPDADVHPLHAGGAGERAHEPVVDAVEVVVVHAGEETDWFADYEFHHADWAFSLLPPVFLLPLLLGALDGLVAGAGQALDEGEPLHQLQTLLL